MHPLSFLLILFSTAAALPATPASPTPPCTMAPPTSPPPRPFLPTGTALPIDDNDAANPTPSPIYTTIRFPFPSNASSSSNASVPCASMRRPLRLGPARLHKKPSPTSNDNGRDSVTPAAAVVAAAAAAAAVETPDDGPRDYASLIPPAPGVTPRPEPNLAELGYYQTTYYSCATRGVSVHCGWHRPIMVAPAKESAAAGAAGTTCSTRAAVITALVGLVAVVCIMTR